MKLTPDEAARVINAYRRDPVRWAQDVLGVSLWTKQADILESLVVNRITTVKSCHSVGKDFTAAVAILWWLFNFSPSKAITTGPSKRQVDGILWSEVATLHRKARQRLGGTLLTSKLTLDDDWWGWGFTAPDYSNDRFNGFKSPRMLVIADEAAGIKPAIFEGLDSLMTGEDARMLMIGNPTVESGDFGDSFKRKGASKFTVDAFSTPNLTTFGITIGDIRTGAWREKITGALPAPYLVTPVWVREKWEKWGEDSPLWLSRVMGQFPKAGDDQLFPSAWCEAAYDRWDELDDANGWIPEERIGQDVARFGPDSSVTALGHYSHRIRQGVRQLLKRRGLATDELEGHVRWVMKQEGDGVVRQIRIDADGLGAGPYDHLHRDLGDMVIEIRGGFRAREPARFINSRAEMYWKLREDLDPANPKAIALPRDEDLHHQLVSIKYRINPKGLIQVESKDDMRARGLPSPDEADAVVYCNAEFGDRPTIAPDTENNLRSGPVHQGGRERPEE